MNPDALSLETEEHRNTEISARSLKSSSDIEYYISQSFSIPLDPLYVAGTLEPISADSVS